MQSGWSENMSPDRNKAIDELVRGRELTTQLRDLLHNKSVGDEGLVGSEDLVVKILNSFANTLSILNNSGADYDEVSQKPKSSNTSSNGRKSEDSGESIKSSKQKDRRGCYKRRKCDDSWTKDTPALIDDGHAWRKYGQKTILNANHPRNYYRCTHKTDQLCQATKQVQQIEDDPPKYRTIYYGRHTCANPFKPSQIILESPSSSKDSSILLSFANNNDQECHLFSSVKQETKEELISMPSELTHNRSSSSDDFYLLSPTFESSVADQMTGFSGVAEPAELFSEVVESVDIDCYLHLQY